MRLILLLNTVVEGLIGFLFLFYPSVTDLFAGMGDAEGNGMDMLVHMYGVAALTMALLSAIAYFSRHSQVLLLTVAGLLAVFHTGITFTQFVYSPDWRGAMLHLIMAVLFLYAYVRWRQVQPEAVA